jgi:hypothetical protein
MIFNTADPLLEMPEEDGLEITIELELPLYEPEREMDLVDQLLPERYALQEEYILERQEKEELEGLAKLLQERIP